MAPLTVTRVTDGVVAFQSELWATNSVLVRAGDKAACLVCDPSIFPDEIEEVRAAARDFDDVYLLITHSDFDHVCGIPAFAEATVVAGATTAAVIADGTAGRQLEAAASEWDTGWPGGDALRVDVVIDDAAAGMRCGGSEVRALDATGHLADGVAFIVAERGLLLPGDYLSAVCHPIVLASVAGALAANERLLAAVEEHAVVTVIPGHGPVLDADQARLIGRQDVAYLLALQAAATDAVARGVNGEAAVDLVRDVGVPREARPDFEALDLRTSNAVVALAEAGHPEVQRTVTP